MLPGQHHHFQRHYCHRCHERDGDGYHHHHHHEHDGYDHDGYDFDDEDGYFNDDDGPCRCLGPCHCHCFHHHHRHNIIFVNADLTPEVQATLQRQLMITDTMSGSEFDARVAEDPGYPFIIEHNRLRIMVIRPLNDCTNRKLADIVIFVKAGLAAVLACKHGPPRQTFRIDRLTIREISKGNLPKEVEFTGCNIQDNILYPLYGPLCPLKESDFTLAPFGSDGEDDDEFDDGIEFLEEEGNI